MREVLWKVGDKFERKEFDTHAEAMIYADNLMRRGWTRYEVDVHDDDGSMNVSLPLLPRQRQEYDRRIKVRG